MVAEPGERVAQGLGPRPVVGVLEDPPGLLEALGRLEHATRQPERERPEDRRRGRAGPTVGTTQRRPEPPGQAVDHRRRDRDRDGEHRDEREEQAKPDQAQVGRLAEQVVGGRVVVDGTSPVGVGPGCSDGYIRRSPVPADGHRRTSRDRTNGCVRAPPGARDDEARVHPLRGPRRARHRARERRLGRAPRRSALLVGAAHRRRDGRPAAALLDDRR